MIVILCYNTASVVKKRNILLSYCVGMNNASINKFSLSKGDTHGQYRMKGVQKKKGMK